MHTITTYRESGRLFILRDIEMFHQLTMDRATIAQRDELRQLARMVESPHSCATRHSRIGGLLVMVAEVRKGWRNLGFVAAYLIAFYLVMRFVFQMKDFK